MKTVLFVLLDKFADWEAAPLAAAVTTLGAQVKVASPNGQPVRSIGGFTTMPDIGISGDSLNSCYGVVLIGGMSWRENVAETVAPLVRSAMERNMPIGAICDAVVFLARLGILNNITHTGNMLDDLQNYAGKKYSGEKLYRNEPAVRDNSIVTANGTAALEFAREMLVALGMLSPDDSAKWYRLFKSGCYQAQEEAAWWFEILKQHQD